MDWHPRYVQQAAWTRELRAYLFERAGVTKARRVLEVGCGTGAITRELPPVVAPPEGGVVRHASGPFGIDIDLAALRECRGNAPRTQAACADALALPFGPHVFDVVFFHFFLLWVREPLASLAEMKRTTVRGGHILALAEPNYSERMDEPPEMRFAGALQTRSLEVQGADVTSGARLADLFHRAGIRIREAGQIRARGDDAHRDRDAGAEWLVLKSDLALVLSLDDVARIEQMDGEARLRGTRRTYVPTYFVWGQV